MSDFLDYVERNYGCVAEYNRSRFEDEEHEAELRYKANQYFKKNKELLDKAKENGTAISFCESCFECPSYTDIGATAEDDDVPHGICGNLDCKDCEYRKYEAEWKAEVAEREKRTRETIERAFKDTNSKENNKLLKAMLADRLDELNKSTTNYDRLRNLIKAYIEGDDQRKLGILEATVVLLGLSIEEISQKMLGEYDDTIFGGQ